MIVCPKQVKLAVKYKIKSLLIIAAGKVNKNLIADLGEIFTLDIPISGKLATVDLISAAYATTINFFILWEHPVN